MPTGKSPTVRRVLMQDFTGVPAVVDLAAMREAVKRLAAIRRKLIRCRRLTWLSTTRSPSTASAMTMPSKNVRLEMERNHERYAFLRWGQQAFSRFSVVPPGTGICHQVNLEYLGRAVWSEEVNGVGGVAGYAGGHRLPYHHDQRSWRAGLGRRRD
jgi:aconitate hydratase